MMLGEEESRGVFRYCFELVGEWSARKLGQTFEYGYEFSFIIDYPST
jgi:hypothetical protein